MQPPGTRKYRQICGLIHLPTEADFEPTCEHLRTQPAHSKRWFPWRRQWPKKKKGGSGLDDSWGLLWMEDIIPVRHNNPHHPQKKCPRLLATLVAEQQNKMFRSFLPVFYCVQKEQGLHITLNTARQWSVSLRERKGHYSTKHLDCTSSLVLC